MKPLEKAMGGSDAELEQFLLSRSALPGPRANLEIASQFASCAASLGCDDRWFTRLQRWALLSPADAPENTPYVYLVFCALQALGCSYVALSPMRQAEARRLIFNAAGDSRWRVREASAMAMQCLGERDFAALRGFIDELVQSRDMLRHRAAMAALAHPPILGEPAQVSYALQAADAVVRDFVSLGPQQRSGESYRVLRKGLDYSLSVLVAASPEEGFAMLGRWARSDELEVKKMIASNLSKARLAKRFPEHVERVGEILSA